MDREGAKNQKRVFLYQVYAPTAWEELGGGGGGGGIESDKESSIISSDEEGGECEPSLSQTLPFSQVEEVIEIDDSDSEYFQSSQSIVKDEILDDAGAENYDEAREEGEWEDDDDIQIEEMSGPGKLKLDLRISSSALCLCLCQ